MVKYDESVGIMKFALVTSERVEEPFTVQLCTRELNSTEFASIARSIADGLAAG